MGNLIEEVDNGGNSLARYAQPRAWDEELSQLRSGNASYYQADGLGSVTSLSNSAGVLANTYTFDSFGKLTASSGTLTNPLQYTAREFDQETGLYYYRARYYDPTVGRLLSEDPMRFASGIDFYPYADNDPVDNVDPTGMVTTICTKPLHALGKAGPWAKDNIQWLPLYHEYFCVEQGDGIVCGGQDWSGNPVWGKGKPSDDTKGAGTCTLLDQGHDCFEDCIKSSISDPDRPDYSVQRWPGRNCQQWANDVVKKCTAQCRNK